METKPIFELKALILKKLDLSKSWGVICNQIQDVAADHLDDSAWKRYAELSDKDMQECEGGDFLQMNGHFWDWKEFPHATAEIVSTFLDYFDAPSLAIINQYL